jgi:hypothetical protein
LRIDIVTPLLSCDYDGVDEGVDDGVDEGVLDGVDDGVADGVLDGVADGVAEGVLDGVAEGVLDGVADGVLEYSSRTSCVPMSVSNVIVYRLIILFNVVFTAAAFAIVHLLGRSAANVELYVE